MIKMFYQTRRIYSILVTYLALNTKLVMSNGWNMADMETEGRKLCVTSIFSDKISYLICSEHPTFHQQDDS